MMRAQHKQQGLTGISILVIVVVIGFFGLMAIQLFPLYYNSFVVSSVFKDLPNAERGDTPHQLRVALQKRLDINEIENVDAKNAVFKKAPHGGIDVTLHYELRTTFIANIDFVLSFDEHAVVPRR